MASRIQNAMQAVGTGLQTILLGTGAAGNSADSEAREPPPNQMAQKVDVTKYVKVLKAAKNRKISSRVKKKKWPTADESFTAL